MKVEIKIDETRSKPKIVIITDKMTDEIAEIVQRLSSDAPQMLLGFLDETARPIEQKNIVRVYAANQKVYAATEQEEYRLRMRLYEAEERLDKKTFVRISNSEIINLKHVKKFDLSLTGTICVYLSDKNTAYVSRRYVSKIKKTLGL